MSNSELDKSNKLQSEKLQTLKKPLGPDALASISHAEFMKRLHEAREAELRKHDPDASSQIKP